MATEVENRDNRKVDREAEKSIISSMLQDQSILDTVFGSMTGDEFSVEKYRKIYDAIYDLSKSDEIPNIVMVRDYLISKGEKDDIVDMNYLSDIAIFTTNPQEVKTFINIVKEKYIIRKTLEICNNINRDCVSSDLSSEDILNNAQQKLFKLAEEKSQREYVRLPKIYGSVIKKIGEAAKSKDGITGVRTGFRQLDEWTSGLQNSDLVILAARPSIGKTAFALNLAYRAIQNGAKVAFFSLEMSKEQLATRILSMETGISSEKLRSGNKLSNKDWTDIYTATSIMPDDFIIDDSSNITIAELRSKCRKIKSNNGKMDGLDIVFIDYLQLMHAGDVSSDAKYEKYINNRQEEVAEISRSLKSLAKELNIPIVALAQTRRPSDTSDKRDKRPQLEDLKESGAIEQDADVVMFLHRPNKDSAEMEEVDKTQVIIAKHRNGRTGTITLRFDGTTMKFYEFENTENI